MNTSEQKTFSGNAKDECPGACPGKGIVNSPFFWLNMIRAAIAMTIFVLAGLESMQNYPLKYISNWAYLAIAALCYSAVDYILIMVFAAKKFPSSGESGTKLHSKQYSTSLIWSKFNMATMVVVAGLILKFWVQASGETIDAYDTHDSTNWGVQTGPMGQWFSGAISFTFIATFFQVAAVIIWIFSELYVEKKKMGAKGMSANG